MTTRLRRFVPAFAFAGLCLVIGSLGFVFMQGATQALLEADARGDAENWANQLSHSLPELPAIARGAATSADTLNIFRQSTGVAQIYSFRVYDRNGLLKLRSDDFSNRLSINQPVEKIDPEFAPAVRNGRPATFIHRGQIIGEPDYFAASVLPIKDGANSAGWLVAFVDQSKKQALFFQMALKVSVAGGLLLVLAALLGFWSRTRQKFDFERQLEHISQRDALTGLANRATFLAEVSQLLGEPRDGQSALIEVELAGLPTIMHNHGSEAANAAIMAAAERLRMINSSGHPMARIDNSRFGLFIAEVSDPMEVLGLAKDLTAKLTAPVQLSHGPVVLHPHAGIALAPSDGKDAAALARSAELAVQSAIEQGTPGYGFFNPKVAENAKRQAAVQRAVADGTAAQSFRLEYQPVYNIRTGELSGFESLIRLHDPELGNVSPGEFIPVAEEMGLITRIGAWGLEEACRAAAQWPVHLLVAVNMSPDQFYSGTLLTDVRRALDGARLPAYRLEIEITEGTLLKDSAVVLEQLRILREMGVSIALDDFGTGYSSLSYLWKFPFSKLKIDRAFVAALDSAAEAHGILRSIVKLGHGLGLTITAEGIETEKQLIVLRELGCDLAQGYLLDRPARQENLAAIILRNFANGLPGKAGKAADTAAAAA